jgi:hypothetical protein
VLERFNLAETDPSKVGLDARMIVYQRGMEKLLTRGLETPAVVT